MGRLTNQLVTLSELNEVIQFATKTETDVDGFPKTGIVASGVNVRGKIVFVSTNEAQSENQEKFTTEIKIWVRYNPAYNQYQYILWNDVFYDIYAIEKISGDRFNVIKARAIAT